MISLRSTFEKLNTLNSLMDKIKTGSYKNLYISPLYGSVKPLFILKLTKEAKQIVVLLPDTKNVEEFKVELEILSDQTPVIAINELTPEPLQERLTDLTNKQEFILLVPVEFINYVVPVKENLERTTTQIIPGGDVTYNDLLEYLNLLSYSRDKFVEAPGYYSQRGSIIDFWSYSEKNPVRLEFDGDFLESIRFFDPESQRSIETVTRTTLAAPLTSGNGRMSTGDFFSYLNEPIIIASLYELQNLSNVSVNVFIQEEASAVKEINNEEVISEDEFPELTIHNEIRTEKRINNDITGLVNKNNIRWILEEEISSDNRIDLSFTDAPTINSRYEILFSYLMEYAKNSYNIFITAENDLQTNRLKELLSEYNDSLDDLINTGKVKIETLAIKSGFAHKTEKLLVLTDYQIFNKPYRTKLPGKKYKRSKSKEFASIKKGDYVVHEDYGIGKYAGLETIKIGEVDQESMKILYNEGGVVYVNLNYLSLVKRYSSNENLVPTLSTLGTGEWLNTKQRTKKKIKEAARDLIELYAKRKATSGYSFSQDTLWQKELEASFFYEDTPDQEKVTKEVKSDMEANNPMDRLVCGDVGFGKTEIAVRAAFKAAQEGKQSCVLVPTTILAEQHYNTFKDRLSQFPVRVAAISRFQTKKEQIEILKQLEAGQIDVIIGTHRLLSSDIKFKDIGLLIIDEEHRFGVTAKEKLRSLKINVDTLTLTATPIPRTLNLSLLGARDLSIIATPPPNRQPIYTTVSTFDVFKIKEWILTEINRNGQVYLVHDRVQSIDKLAAYLKKYIPQVKVGIAHGQLKPSQLEEIIHGFLNRKYDVLLSTKIIESGIDIPNVNTIIVNRADRFGLAELHQLRGRVGRSNRQAYAYFIVPSLSGITKKALRRLQAIEEFTEIGAGFNLSMRDLEIRGAGNLLGTEQTGFINEVGFDLYVKLINEAVEELKYLEFKEVFKNLPKPEERTEPSIDTYFEIGITEFYMPDQMDRLNFYTALYSIKSLKEAADLKEEMIDRFGELPINTKRLLSAAELKYYASYALFERIIIQRKNIFIILPRGEKEEYYRIRFVELMRFIVDKYGSKLKFSQQKDVLKLVMPNTFINPEELMDFLNNFCREVAELFNNSPDK